MTDAELDELVINQPIVIDNGTGVLKAGFAGADEPQALLNSYVGRPKHKRVMTGAVEGDWFAGERAEELRGLLKLKRPLEHGRGTDYVALEKLWRYVFQSILRAQSDEHPVLLTEPLLNPRQHREKCAELLFETFRVPALCISPAPVLSLYAAGRTTGLVLDVGEGVTQSVPIVEGFVVSHAVSRVDVAGAQVTEQLAKLLARTGHLFSTTTEMEVVREMKEAACYVATDCTAEEDLAARTSHKRSAAGSPWGGYKLPDGTVIELGPERFRAPEVLFRPDLVGDEGLGVHNLVASSIARTDIDLRTRLYSSILLAGGSTRLPGFGQRLLGEMRRVAPVDTRVRIMAPQDRATSAWIGGSILASLSTFKKMWVTKQEYEQYGAKVLHRKFF